MTQEQNSENSYILEGLLQEYHSIWLVDKNDLTFTLYRAGETTGAKKAFEIAFKLKTYDKILEAYVQNVVAERDRERVRKDADVKNILKQIKKKGIFTINYLRFNNERKEVYKHMEHKNIVATVYLKNGKAVPSFHDDSNPQDICELCQRYNDSGIDKIIICAC